MVVIPHGGPHGIFGDQWHHRWNAQVVAAAGYVVAMVNFLTGAVLGERLLKILWSMLFASKTGRSEKRSTVESRPSSPRTCPT